MAVTMADITKLRKMSGAGMMDCKKALTESDGDIEKAMEIIRKKGQAIAAKRSDREAAEGCVLAKKDGEFAAIIALKCETDFVAKNEDFIALTQAILDAAVANKCKTLDEVKALPMGKGTVPVSYTHLDVYKRQYEIWVNDPDRTSGCSLCGEVVDVRYFYAIEKETVFRRSSSSDHQVVSESSRRCHTRKRLHDPGSVSYTHLTPSEQRVLGFC